MDNLGDVRKEYNAHDPLNWDKLPSDPITQFAQWYRDAEKAGIEEPNAMTLATVSPEGQPSARVVLLKGFNKEGFSFYTNYQSRKGVNLISNPRVALVFWWKELFRQVRIEGLASKLPQSDSENYFQSRPRDSQISAWASPQSSEISYGEMLRKREEIEKKFEGIDPLPLPDFWGGFLVTPQYIEFWQGRENRYHDRFCYSVKGEEQWGMTRLAP